ncbi:MAG TPA: hypothetical protein VGM98_02965 [Schlesneria sp.]|jgi:hypothetical protein
MPDGFSNSCEVGATNQIVVLQAIVDKLRVDISDLLGSESTCFISDVPWPGVDVQDQVFCTVSPANSQFMLEDPTGAGPDGVIEMAIFQVSAWSKILLDEIERSAIAMTDSTRGSLTLKQRVLKSLAGKQLYSNDGQPLLMSYLRPTSAVHPASGQGKGDFTSFSLAFQGAYYWDLSDQ